MVLKVQVIHSIHKNLSTDKYILQIMAYPTFTVSLANIHVSYIMLNIKKEHIQERQYKS